MLENDENLLTRRPPGTSGSAGTRAPKNFVAIEVL